MGWHMSLVTRQMHAAAVGTDLFHQVQLLPPMPMQARTYTAEHCRQHDESTHSGVAAASITQGGRHPLHGCTEVILVDRPQLSSKTCCSTAAVASAGTQLSRPAALAACTPPCQELPHWLKGSLTTCGNQVTAGVLLCGCSHLLQLLCG
jgi:hypothetical protein